jgi:hypothetical protein
MKRRPVGARQSEEGAPVNKPRLESGGARGLCAQGRSVNCEGLAPLAAPPLSIAPHLARFLANAAETDRTKPPKLLCRPLVCLRIELAQSRIATSAKLKAEWERRSADNSTAVDVLHANAQLWNIVHGPSPEDLFRPTAQALAEARRAADDLEGISRSRKQFPDGYDVFAKECVDAARQLRPLDWSAIHAEKFPITPEVIFLDLAKNAEALMRKEGAEEQRRLAWLQQEAAEVQGAVPLRQGNEDRFRCDPDRFTGKCGRLPNSWGKAVQIASWVHIDEMRTLLELHYGMLAHELT